MKTTIEQQCAEAMARINAACGQHKRAIRAAFAAARGQA